MELIKEGIFFSNWGQILVGVMHDWLGISEVCQLAKDGCVPLKESRLEMLAALQTGTKADLIRNIQNFMKEDNLFAPVMYEQDNPLKQYYPEEHRPILYDNPVYWDIWEVEFLLGVRNKNLSYVQFQVEVGRIGSNFRHLYDWYSFNRQKVAGDCKAEDEGQLYANFTRYLSIKLSLLKLNNAYF